jgi:hypothetical protein
LGDGTTATQPPMTGPMRSTNGQTYGAVGAVTGWVHTRQRRQSGRRGRLGAAAVVLRQHPTRINNQVKALLT